MHQLIVDIFDRDRPAARGVVVLLLIAAVAWIPGCVTEESFEREAEDANYCEVAEECVAISPGCPLGCWVLVNEAEEERIRDLAQQFHDQQTGAACDYSCTGLDEPRCEEGRCVADELL